MARLRFTPASAPSGFRPIQVSQAEITRMQQESDRVIANMQRNRQAEMQQRREMLQTMKEDANYTRQAQDRNFQIQQQNLRNELLQSQFDARTAEGQAAENLQSAQQIFGGLAQFSQAAADITQKIEAKRIKREEGDALLKAVRGEDFERGLAFREGELTLLEGLEKYNLNVNIQEASGLDPGTVAQGRLANPGNTYLANRSNSTWILKNQFPLFLDSILNDTETQFEYNGQIVTPAAARSNPELMRDLSQFAVRQFTETKGFLGLDPLFLFEGLRYIDEHNNTLIKGASANRIKNTYAIHKDQQDSIVLNDPARFEENAPIAFRNLVNNPLVGAAGAHEALKGWATHQKPDGSFTVPIEAVRNMVLRPDGKTYDQEWPGRWSEIIDARTNAEMRFAQREMQIDNISFEQDSRRILQGLTEDPTQANADAAIKFFRETHGKVPPELLKFASSYTTEAVEKIESAKRFLSIPSGLITLEAVEAAESIDYDTGRELRKRFAEQEAQYNSGIYKETAEAFKTTANGVTAYGTNKPNTPASVFLQTMMRSEFRKRVDKAVAGGMDFNQAATAIGQQLDAEVKAGSRDPNSPWYRKVDAPGGTPTFPNLNKGMMTGVEAANRRYNELKKNIATQGLAKVIDTKDSIITAQEAQEIVKGYGRPGFTVPADVQAVAGMSNGLDPMVIINRQLAAQGMQPLAPPPSMQTTSQLISPAFQKLLYKTPSQNRSARALGTANTFNTAIIPNNLGPIIQQAAQANGVNPSYIAALAEIESGFNQGSTSYNGSSFGVMQISRKDHPTFFAQQNWRDPQANINYGAQYYAGLLKKYGDPVKAAMAYNAGPGNYDAYLRGELPDGPIKTEMLNHGKKFAKAMYKYGGGAQALNNPSLMRSGSPLEVSTLMRTPVRPLQSFSPQVSSITFDTGQPGIDVFFEDKQFPAVLPGVVKDISFQGGQGSGYGNYVVIESIDPDTNQKVDVLYSHLASKPNLQPGQMIRTGQIIGQQGGTGRVVSADGTIASIDFLRPAPRGSKDMTPYGNYESLRRRIASQFKS